jgi:A/G-specific adenine glycosylase
MIVRDQRPVRIHKAVRGSDTNTAEPDLDARRVSALRRRLLGWAAREGRTFFWRTNRLTPFQALVAEILLTTTRAELVDVTASELLRQYPTPAALAAARRSDLERLLYPLGLYRKRAAGLIACAKALLDRHGGEVPRTIEELVRLPSVGRYAASAVACVVFDEHVAVVDANVSRIYQRMFSLPPPPDRLANAHVHWAVAQRALPRRRAKAFNWAVLDLGGMVCTAKTPGCERCPVATNCDAFRRSNA